MGFQDDQMSMDTFLAIALVAGAVGGFVLHDMFLSRLRALHPDIWDALGPPSRFFDDSGLATFSAVRQFFRRPEYQAQCTAELVKLANCARIYVRVYTAIGLIVLVLALIFVSP